MPQLTSKSFLSALRNAQLLTDARMAQVEQEFGQGENLKTLAIQLVRSGELTKWQAKFLLSGRDTLRLGNYILRQRVCQNELGDQMLAIHHRLDRQVDLQILPSGVNEQSTAFQSFLRLASEVARLDHPSLIHVYDIDREGGRYYLVSEHFEAQTLDQILETGATWNVVTLGSIARQLFGGLAFAHADKVLHGDICNRVILVAADGTAKIGNLAIAALSRVIGEHRGDEPARATLDPQDDYRRLAESLIRFIDQQPNESSPQDRGELNSILSPLMDSATEDEVAEAILALDHWIDDHQAPVVDDLKPGLDSNAKRRAPSYRELATTTKKPNESRGSAKSITQKIPIWRIAPLISLTLLVGLLGWTIYRNTRGGNRAASSSSVEQKPMHSQKKSGSNKNSSTSKPNHQPSFADSNQGQPVAGISDSELEIEPKEPKAPAKKSKSTTLPKPIAEPVSKSSEITQLDQSAPVVIESVIENKGEQESDDSKPHEPNASETKETESSTSNANESIAPPTKHSDNITSEKTSEEPNSVGTPFANTPPAVDLKNTTETGEIVLGEVHPGEQYLLACSLETNDAATRRTKFTLEKGSGDQSQAWTVTGQPSSGDPIKIAQFSLAGTDLKFQWLADAARDPTFTYLRNCLLKLESHGESFSMRLRQPVKIGEATITADDPQSTLNFELEGFPLESGLVVAEFLKIAELKFEGDDESFVLLVEPDDQRIPPRDPLFIFFTEKVDRFLFIELNARITKKSEIEAALRIVQDPKPRPYSEKLVADAENFFKRSAIEASQVFERASVYVAPEGQKTKHKAEVKRLKEVLAVAQAQVADFAAQKRRAQATFSKPIRFRVFYTLNETEIDLATWDGKIHPIK